MLVVTTTITIPQAVKIGPCSKFAYAALMARPKRPRPRDLTSSWPDKISPDVSGEVARQLANNLRRALDGRALRIAKDLTGVDHTTIGDVLAGFTWPDLMTITRLESGLGTALWPSGLAPELGRPR